MNLASLLSGPLPPRAAAVAGVAGAAAITVLYLIRLRRRRVIVPFAPLWLAAAGPRRTTSWARRLRDVVSLLLALVLLGLVLLAAVDPRPAAADRSGRSIVVLIDRSASMSARDRNVGSSTRLDEARARATAILDGLAAADRALVASFAADAVAESRCEAAAGRLRGAGGAMMPGEEPGGLTTALAFASAALRGRPRPPVARVSDGGVGEEALRMRPPGLDLRFAPVGRRGGNVGIIQFAARRVPADPSAV